MYFHPIKRFATRFINHFSFSFPALRGHSELFKAILSQLHKLSIVTFPTLCPDCCVCQQIFLSSNYVPETVLGTVECKKNGTRIFRSKAQFCPLPLAFRPDLSCQPQSPNTTALWLSSGSKPIRV